MGRELLVRLVNVSKTFTVGGIDVQVLSDINLSIERGSFVSVTGPHGSGKATLLNIIGCISRPSAGRVVICGTDTTRESDESLSFLRKRRIGYLTNAFSLIPELTAMENLELALRVLGETGRDMEDKAAVMLNTVGLEGKEHALPGDLRAAEARRLAIARSMVGNPPLLICDDPTAGLREADSRAIVGLLMRFNADRGTTVVCGTSGRLEGAPKVQVRVVGGRAFPDAGVGG